ncbi:MAG: hypothetical protein ACK5MN_03850 [Lachnospiraceae bacterium]
MNPSLIKRRFAAVLIVLLLLTASAATLTASQPHNHRTHEAGCPVCVQIHTAAAFLNQLSGSIEVLLVAAVVLCFLAFCAGRLLYVLTPRTPIGEKVRLNP